MTTRIEQAATRGVRNAKRANADRFLPIWEDVVAQAVSAWGHGFWLAGHRAQQGELSLQVLGHTVRHMAEFAEAETVVEWVKYAQDRIVGWDPA